MANIAKPNSIITALLVCQADTLSIIYFLIFFDDGYQREVDLQLLPPCKPTLQQKHFLRLPICLAIRSIAISIAIALALALAILNLTHSLVLLPHHLISTPQIRQRRGRTPLRAQRTVEHDRLRVTQLFQQRWQCEGEGRGWYVSA